MTYLPAPPRDNSVSLPDLLSPKQPPLAKDRDWYPYYPGFTEHFARDILYQYLPDVPSVLDPWSGSGTTNIVCARSGILSIGIDINPALSVIARARFVPKSSEFVTQEAALQLVASATPSNTSPDPSDPLCKWMRRKTVTHIRTIQKAIHSSTNDAISYASLDSLIEDLPSLPDVTCFYYSALFATVRDLLTKFITTNPMWLKFPPTYRHKIAPSWHTLTATFLAHIQYLSQRLTLDSPQCDLGRRVFRTASALNLNFPDGYFGGALTSPPYATRVDYVIGMLPELAVLKANDSFLAGLRAQMTGTPVLTGGPGQLINHCLTSAYARHLNLLVSQHPSPGSRSYYGPWLHKYFVDLQCSLAELTRTVSMGGPICIVAQDSFYKELHINLQRLITEIMASHGRNLVNRKDFPVRTLLSSVNPRAKHHLKARNNVESVLLFS